MENGSSGSKTLRFVVDSREQRGYSLENAVKATLPAGDYSVVGYEQRIAVERKSIDDWLNTVLRSRDRFAREVEKLRHYDFAAIVLETTPQDLLAGNYASQLDPAAAFGITAELMVRFRPVHVILAGDRPHARLLTEKLLRFAVRLCNEKDERRGEEEKRAQSDSDQSNCNETENQAA